MVHHVFLAENMSGLPREFVWPSDRRQLWQLKGRHLAGQLNQLDDLGMVTLMWVNRNVIGTTHQIDGWNATNKNGDFYGGWCK